MKENKTTADLLRDAWKLKKIVLKPEESENFISIDYYVSEVDFYEIREEKRNEFLQFYQMHVLPQPFFGNIKNPKIIVLAKNPAYDIFNEVIEFEELKSKYKENNVNDENLENFIKNNGNDLLFNMRYIENSVQKDYCTKKWWHTVFKDLIPENNFNNLLGKVGIFNLCGYHSRNYYKFPSDFLKHGDRKFFPTQLRLQDHLKQKIPKADLVIIIWGEQVWRDFLGEAFPKQNLLVVNKEIATYNTIRTIVNSKNFTKQIDENFKEKFKIFLTKDKKETEKDCINVIKDYIKKGNIK